MPLLSNASIVVCVRRVVFVLVSHLKGSVALRLARKPTIPTLLRTPVSNEKHSKTRESFITVLKQEESLIEAVFKLPEEQQYIHVYLDRSLWSQLN